MTVSLRWQISWLMYGKYNHTNAADQAVPNDVNKLNASNIGRD